MNKSFKLPDPRKQVPKMDFQQIQQEQQKLQRDKQKQEYETQMERQRMIGEMMQKDWTDLTKVLNEETIDKLRAFVLHAFAERPASDFKVSHKDYLELFERIFDKEEVNFNLIEVGILSDMVFTAKPHLTQVEEVRDLLKFRLEVVSIFNLFNQRVQAITQFVGVEMQKKIEVVKSTIIS